MADRVIVAGIHRANIKVEPMTVRQMCGRAGRPKIKDGKPVLSQGDAYVLLPEAGFNALKDEFSEIEPVASRLNDLSTLAFHIVSEVVQGRIVDASSFAEWHSRSLAHAQGQIIERSQIEDVFAALLRIRAIEASDDGETYAATKLGRISYHMYFSPYMVGGWFFNFSKLFASNARIDAVNSSWALSNVRDYSEGIAGAGESADNVKRFIEECAKRGLQIDKAAAVVGTAYRGLMADKFLPGLEGVQAQLRSDSSRVMSALTLAEEMCAPKWRYGRWNDLGARIMYGVPSEMIPLIRLAGVGGKRARVLWAHGIRSPKDLVSHKDMHEMLRSSLGSKTFDSILAAARPN